MNGDSGESRLPELADEDVEILYRICKVATQSNTSANSAVFTGYYKIFDDLERDTRHDNAIFRWITRLARIEDAKLSTKPDFVARLRALLEQEQGITVVDDAESIYEEQGARQLTAQRRVSFDDAHYEETWLSNHIQPLEQDVGRKHGRVHFSEHVRSLSHDTSDRIPRHTVQLPPQADVRPQLSEAEVEMQLEAFWNTTCVRHARRYLSVWRNVVLNKVNDNLGREMAAAQHDRQQLQKQAFGIWRDAYLERVQQNQLEIQEQSLEARLASAPYLAVKRSILNTWRAHFEDVKAVEQPAREHMLRFRYFGRWKTIALENQSKVQSILLRKYAIRWLQVMDVVADRSVKAKKYYDKSLLRGCLSIWIDRINTRLQQQRREDDLVRRMVRNWRKAVFSARRFEAQAEAVNRRQRSRAALMTLTESLQDRCARELQAGRIHENSLLHKASSSLKRHASTLPILQEVRATKSQRTKQDILAHWRQCTLEHQQAVQHDRTRLLERSVKKWNDALRIRTLDHRINDRLKAEMLYRIMLEERSRRCTRLVNTRLLQQGWYTLQVRAGDAAATQERRITHFGDELQRRRLSQAVQHIYLEMRKHEDADRAATEFRNARIVPKAWQMLRVSSVHVSKLNTWSHDASFFVATKKTLQKWKSKTEQSKQDKRHQAYITVRSNIKARLLRGAWTAMTERTESINGQQVVSYQRRERIDEASVRKALSSLRKRVARLKTMHDIAAKHDRSVSTRSAFATLVATHDNLTELDALAEDMRFDVDATTQATVLKRLHFAAFALARLEENSTVYQKRHRDQHTRQMLRHLAHIANERRAHRQEEPESPSIRPASRATSRPEFDTSIVQSAKRQATGGPPAYLKTPSRARRTRPRTIPTPAPFTPFAFTSNFLASTPAPAQSMLDATALETDDTLPQITPFNRKLRASGINTDMRPTSILRSRQFGASMLATDKSVRFAGASRFHRPRND